MSPKALQLTENATGALCELFQQLYCELQEPGLTPYQKNKIRGAMGVVNQATLRVGNLRPVRKRIKA